MVRTYWTGPLFGVLALTSLAQGQTTTPAVPAKASESNERYVTVGDMGKPGQKCRVLKTWTMPNGNPAYQVQALDTGELLTIEESESAGASASGGLLGPKATRIFHWGRDAQMSPHGSPEPPPGAVVLAQPSDVHSPTAAPPLAATVPSTVPAKTHGNWPAAFVERKPIDSIPAPTVKRLAPVAPLVVKKVELTPMLPAPVTAKPVQAAPVASAPVAVGGSPYNPKCANAPVVKAPEPKPWFWASKTFEAKAVAPTGSPSMPANSNFWSAETTWNPAPPPPAPAKRPELAAVKAPTTTTAKVEATPAQPGDWRESWGKIPTPKSAPIRIEERSATAAAPKVELPHAAVKADDPLKAPEKFAAMPKASDIGAFGSAPIKEAKKPMLAMLATNAPPATLKIEEKKPERPAATIPPPPPVPVVQAAAAAPAKIVPPTVAKVAPPAPAEIVPSVIAKASTTKPVDPASVAAEVKPAVPLGMQSVLAARSPELATPAPKKPTASSQAQAMGIGVDEPNAFTAAPPGGIASTASNGFWTPKKPAPAANPLADGVAWRTASSPAGCAMPAASVVTQAGYRQENSSELSQLAVVMHESLYPSQREWAAERLASMDWRRQPQVLDLLMERAKQDAAPTVRAECVRSLGRMKSDAPGVVEAVKSLRSDADPRVRQEADEALANLTGPPPAWGGMGMAPSH
jgi:hypothetical protein